MSAALETSGALDEDGPFNMPDNTPFFINWTSDTHTPIDIPVTSTGPLSESLIGTYENTYIFDVMKLHLQ